MPIRFPEGAIWSYSIFNWKIKASRKKMTCPKWLCELVKGPVLIHKLLLSSLTSILWCLLKSASKQPKARSVLTDKMTDIFQVTAVPLQARHMLLTSCETLLETFSSFFISVRLGFWFGQQQQDLNSTIQCRFLQQWKHSIICTVAYSSH